MGIVASLSPLLFALLVYIFRYVLLTTLEHRKITTSTRAKMPPKEMRPRPENAMRALEKLVRRRISIDIDETTTQSTINPQDASPLFSLLPGELRNLIWAFASTQDESDDPDSKFDETAYCYRPDHRAWMKTCYALLLTCRRAWFEAHALPMLQAEQCYYNADRAAPDARSPDWMASLSELNRRNFGCLRLFAQSVVIEKLTAGVGHLRAFFLTTEPAETTDFQPRELHVTIRHTDWWYWESETPLRLKNEWVQALLDSPDLRSTQTLHLSLETLDYKLDQLQPILARMQLLESAEIETHVIDGKAVKTRFVRSEQIAQSTWSGPANLNNQSFDPYKDKTSLTYTVVTLTWHLAFFPCIPHAQIPILRRAPRLAHPESALAIQMRGRDGQMMTPLQRLSNHMRRHTQRRTNRPLPIGRRYLEGRQWQYLIAAESRERAEDGEAERREVMGAWTAARRAEKVDGRWRAQRSLLRFV